MVEQLPINRPENESVTLTSNEIVYVQCLMNRKSEAETSYVLGGLSIAPIRDQLIEKMIGDDGLEKTLKGVKRLPFVSEYRLSEMQTRVDRLKNSGLGHSQVDVAVWLGLDQGTVKTHLKRVEQKKIEEQDKVVPVLNLEKFKSIWAVGHAKAIHWVIKEKLGCFEMVSGSYSNLSVNESTALLWRCTGRSEAQIADEMNTSDGSVQTYIKRASKKLGIQGRHPLVAATVLEIMRD